MDALTIILLIFILTCAVLVSFTKDLLTSIILFMSLSTAMCVIWILLESPDLAITEAAVGAGVTSLMMFVALKRMHAIKAQKERDDGKNE